MSETVKHTPGPWAAEERSLNISVGSSRYPGVCRVYGLNDLGRANARLIAAAPDMAAEGQFLLDRLEEFERDLSNAEFFRDWSGHVAPAISRFRATIAKATGAGDAR